MARKLFGTDGIRGVAGEYPLDRATVYATGAALGKWARSADAGHEVVIGMDTRESGSWLAAEVAGGLKREGVGAQFAGVTTTPGVAYFAKKGPFAAGVMISASHNPYRDNGIKVIDHSGYKLPDDVEERLETELFAYLKDGLLPEPVDMPVNAELDHTYIEHLVGTASMRFDGLKLAVDCANGSASLLGPELFERLGATVVRTSCAPDGRNINLNCGSLHLGSLREVVLKEGADLGIAFDGDADRALFVSHDGRIIDGDAVMLICARRLQEQGKLGDREGKPVVVATVMSNLGLQRALAAHGIEMVRTPVGDKYVLEEMLRRGAMLGGEQAGHVIFREYATTGDGMLTALRVLDAVTASGKGLDELASEFREYPQLLLNVRVKQRRPLDELTLVKHEIAAAEHAFGDSGRVLVRFSGTEPLLRVMVEGPDAERVRVFAERIVSQIRIELGAE
jgi:phosphoglucosamine mutase